MCSSKAATRDLRSFSRLSPSLCFRKLLDGLLQGLPEVQALAKLSLTDPAPVKNALTNFAVQVGVLAAQIHLTVEEVTSSTPEDSKAC